VRDESLTVDEEDFPDEWRSGEVVLPLSYVFEPGASTDGVTVDVPLAQLNQVDAADFWWHVPGRREELVTALIKTLPKQWRRQFVPAPDHARAVADDLVPRARWCRPSPMRCARVRAWSSRSRRSTWRRCRPPADDVPRGRRRAARSRPGKDLDALREQLRPKLRSALARVAVHVEERGLTAWTLGDLPRRVEHRRGTATVQGYPALVDEGATVGVRVFEDEAEQAHAMRLGTRRMLLLRLPSPVVSIVKRLDNRTKLTLASSPYPDVLVDAGGLHRLRCRLPDDAQRRADVGRRRVRAADRVGPRRPARDHL
jgi:ATP-dependent helicase HrpA